MSIQKSKSIENLERRMENLDPETFRYQTLDAARGFKSSWIALGQFLFTIYKDKLFKDWGYLTFEAYCAKEIGIRQPTALKLLKSYSFLETEEPAFLKKEALEEKKPGQIPSYEAVNALRLAKANERISESDYEELREEVLDDVKEEGEVKKKIRYILKTGAKKDSEENLPERKASAIKKLLNHLVNAKNEMIELEMPDKISRQVDSLIESLEHFKS